MATRTIGRRKPSGAKCAKRSMTKAVLKKKDKYIGGSAAPRSGMTEKKKVSLKIDSVTD